MKQKFQNIQAQLKKTCPKTIQYAYVENTSFENKHFTLVLKNICKATNNTRTSEQLNGPSSVMEFEFSMTVSSK